MYKFQHILDDSDARYNAVWVDPKTIMEQELARAFCVIDEKICSHIHPARYYAGSVKRFKAIKLAKVPPWVARMDHLDEMDRALTETLAV